MGKLAERKVALAARILHLDDERLLRSVDELLDRGSFQLTAAELRELQAIRSKHLGGDGASSSWTDAKKRIRRKLKS